MKTVAAAFVVVWIAQAAMTLNEFSLPNVVITVAAFLGALFFSSMADALKGQKL